MKKIALSTLLILVVMSCKSNKPSLTNNSQPEKEITVKPSLSAYEVIKLDSIESVYLIYGKRNDSIFKIASSKNKTINCTPIKKGDILDLNLKSSFRENYYQRRDIAGVNYNGVLIRFDKTDGVVWDLFTTENIKGLCYTK